MRPFPLATMLLLSLLSGCGKPSSPPPMRAATPCTATACTALPADHVAPAGLWGARHDGQSDDAAALNAAFAFCAANPGTEILLTGTSRAGSTVTIPGGCSVRATGATASDPLSGPGIVCDLAVTPCVAAGESSDMKAVALRGVRIGRAAGDIPAGSIGLEVAGINAVVEDPVVTQSDTCIQFYETMGEPSHSGFTAHVERGFLAGCQSYGIEFAGWALGVVHGLYVGSGAFQDVPDYDMKGVFHITGGTCPTGGGPDAVEVSDSNIVAFTKPDGTQAIYDALFAFDHMNVTCQQANIFQFANGHVEEVRHLATSDSSATEVDGFRFVHSTWVGGSTDPTTNWLQLDPATQLLRWTIADDDVYFWNMGPHCGLCLNPNLPIEGLVAADLRFYGRGYNNQPQSGPVNVTIASPTGSWGRISALDMLGGGAISLKGGGAQGFQVSGNFLP